jgi:lantibiotic biosynthesis protein
MRSAGALPLLAASREPIELQRQFRDAGFFVVRSALLPFSVLSDWSEGIGPPGAEAAPGANYGARRAVLVERLRRIFMRSEVAEALFFASARLSAPLESWCAGKPSPKLERTLTRYLLRMAGRATPFGIFAGVSCGTVLPDPGTCLELADAGTYRRHTRPSMGYLHALLTQAAEREDLGEQCRYFPNSTLHRTFGRYRLAQAAADGSGDLLLDVEPSPELDDALEHARHGATLGEIATALAPYASTHAEASEFVRELIAQGLLVPGWLPHVTGPEPFQQAAQTLTERVATRGTGHKLAAACQELEQVDRGPLGEQLGPLRELARSLESDVVLQPLSHVLQADLVKPAPDLTLGSECLRHILRAAELVQRTSAPDDDPRLRDFCRRFVARYDSRCVPLAEALDEDLGIGFDRVQRPGEDVLVHELGLRRSLGARSTGPWDDVRLRILTRALQAGGLAYELDRECLASFPARAKAELPESFALVLQLARGTSRPWLVAPELIAPSGFALLSRFAHADPQLCSALRSYAASERAAAGERVLLDVAHLPAGQVGNILLRPVFRDFELSYAGRSGATEAAQLPLSDLYVTVVEEDIELYSSRLGKRVCIRMTNAHNSEGWWNPPLYRFLGALQRAEGRGLATSWSWGALEAAPFLPRICCEGVVLSRARWRLETRELQPLLTGTPDAALAAVQVLRERLAWPRWLTLSQDDSPLVIDLDNPLSVEELSRAARSLGQLVLAELLPGPDELVVRGPEGGYASEIVVPFVARAPHPPASERSLPRLLRATSAQRSFVPGSEWFYAKIYVGVSQLLPLLRLLRGVLREVAADGSALWFFVPYSDPDHHVRLRVRGTPELQQALLAKLRAALAPSLADGTVTRLQLDTYERELERYGDVRGTELAETLFWHDSEASLELLELCEDQPDLRWQLALGGIDRLFEDFAVSSLERTALVDVILRGLRGEFGVTREILEKIGRKYRAHGSRVADVLDREGLRSTDPGFVAALSRARQIWGKRSERLGAVRAQLTTRDRYEEQLSLLQALAHMHAVRLLGPSVREHELVLYDFLRRHQAMRTALRARPREPRAATTL